MRPLCVLLFVFALLFDNQRVKRTLIQSRWDYVNVHGFGALTVAPALRLQGDYALPSGSRRGMNQHGELAVVEQAQRAEQPTAGRDRFAFMGGKGAERPGGDNPAEG